MIKEFVTAWDKNKDKLKEYIKTHDQDEYDSYKDLVKLLFDIVINPEAEHWRDDDNCRFWHRFDTNNIHEIDDGDYQGSLIFLLYGDSYQPSPSDYVYTSVYYGSCSGCDTLLGINDYVGGLPSDEQVDDYMTLLLHLLQKCHCMNETEATK